MQRVDSSALSPTTTGASGSVDLGVRRRERVEAAARAAIERGDHREAVVHLMEAYGSEVLRYCHRMLGSLEAARDRRQEVFVQAYRGLRGYEGQASLRTWLLAIARHRCLDAIKSERRRRRRESEVSSEPWAVIEAPPEASPAGVSTDPERWEVQRAIVSCLQRLSPLVRATVLLRCQDGLTYSELARMLGQRPKTIQTRVSRATEQLQRCLAGQGVRP